jgi:PAS domain-containing protein
MTGVENDISERKSAEEALHESEIKYRTLFETMDEGFALCELVRDDRGKAVDYRVLEANRASESHTGFPVAKVETAAKAGSVLDSPS